MSVLTISRFPALGYAANEGINTLCTNLSFAGEDVRKIMLTSSHASEGKSWLTMNVMRSMAKQGKTVAVVDADLRRSMLAVKFGFRFENAGGQQGLAHFLAGMVEMQEVIYQTNIPGAYIVPTGREVSNPLPLLVSQRFAELLDHLANNVDYVIVDAPPVGAVIDAAEIAKSCDGTLVVVDCNTVHRRELIEVKQQLDQTGCPILGAVLNRVAYDSYLSRKYYYKSYYSNYERYDLTAEPKKKGKKG